MSSWLTVATPGLLTTVQDLGRWGHQDVGVPVAGAMDPFAHRVANALVGNNPGDATLEITLAGPTISFDTEALFAVTGAVFNLSLDGQPVPMGVAIDARPGSVLRFGERLRGARAYLAVAGGVDVPLVLGSRSTHLPTSMGGFLGRPIRRGDRIPVGKAKTSETTKTRQDSSRAAAASDLAHESEWHRAPVRVLPGPQLDKFGSEALEQLCSEIYTIDSTSDRMGYRLQGVPITRRENAEIISDATPVGSIQVPANGQPLLLMADRQTSGGYPKLATVISADIAVAAQTAPGETLRFKACTRAEALAALVARERRVMAFESRLA